MFGSRVVIVGKLRQQCIWVVSACRLFCCLSSSVSFPSLYYSAFPLFPVDLRSWAISFHLFPLSRPYFAQTPGQLLHSWCPPSIAQIFDRGLLFLLSLPQAILLPSAFFPFTCYPGVFQLLLLYCQSEGVSSSSFPCFFSCFCCPYNMLHIFGE